MSIGDNIKIKRLQLDLTLEELAKKVGTSKQTIQRYESGVIANIPSDKIELLANALNATPAYLMGWEESPTKSIFDYDNILPLPKTHKIPLIGNIACGTPILAEENIEGYIDISSTIKADFCLRCIGDSMINARIFDGDIVFVKAQPDVENGQIGVVLIDNEATLKRIYHGNNEITLRAENPTVPARTISGVDLSDVCIQGLAVAFLGIVR